MYSSQRVVDGCEGHRIRKLGASIYGGRVSWTLSADLTLDALDSPELGRAVNALMVSIVGAATVIGGGGHMEYASPYTYSSTQRAASGLVLSYSWCLLLPAEVLRSLGGARVVMEQAPVDSIIEVRDLGGEECLVVLLTDTVASMTEPRLRAWKEFLAPVLVPRPVRPHVDVMYSKRGIELMKPPYFLDEDWP